VAHCGVTKFGDEYGDECESHGSGSLNRMHTDTCIKVDHGSALDLLCYSEPVYGLANVDPHAAPIGVACGGLEVALEVSEVLDAEHGESS
jgi:hypothetical protein